MRGHREGHIDQPAGRGSIPAYAGAPAPVTLSEVKAQVHPRVCGGTLGEPVPRAVEGGPSPRMRGHLLLLDQRERLAGSIPAYAGAPSTPYRCRRASGVHPRVCGGTLWSGWRAGRGWGPSPRMRGHPGTGISRVGRLGSIPAYAGAPCQCTMCRFFRRVHPRVCGGTDYLLPASEGGRGPSPRMRGHPLSACSAVSSTGSIPAYAGAPLGLKFLKLFNCPRNYACKS